MHSATEGELEQPNIMHVDVVEVVVHPRVLAVATRSLVHLTFVANQHRNNSSSSSTVSTHARMECCDASALAPRAEREEG